MTAETSLHTHPIGPTVNFKTLMICVFVGVCIAFSPTPVGLESRGWSMFALFIATILGLVLKPMPMGAVALVSMTTAIMTGLITTDEALNGFTSEVVWLVLMAFFIAKGFVVTGFGNRIGYFFTGLLGKKTLGLSYGLAFTDLIMAPAVPSVTARSAGIVYPIVQSIARAYESYPHHASSKKVGAFLTITAFQITVITSAMFLTAMAANPILQALSLEEGYQISWGQWALAASLPGMCSLLIIPWVIYRLYPPEITETPEARDIAKNHLAEMGKMSTAEWTMAGTLVLLLVLWIFGDELHVKAVTAAMCGLSILLVTGVLNWRVLLKESSAWETFFWFCILIMLAKFLKIYGVTEWFSQQSHLWFGGVDWSIGFPIVALLYFFSHYFFASSTAHVSAMYVSFLLLAIGLGTPPMLAVWVLIFFSNLFGGITHYSLAPAPLLYGVGYVHLKDWWKLGFYIALVNIVIWSVIGGLWWKTLGYW